MQKYFRTRENRNFSTVRSTEKRIVNFSLVQCGLIVCMGALQVFIVRFFFQVGWVAYGMWEQSLTSETRERERATYEGVVGSFDFWIYGAWDKTELMSGSCTNKKCILSWDRFHTSML